jgi:hypothetical protein
MPLLRRVYVHVDTSDVNMIGEAGVGIFSCMQVAHVAIHFPTFFRIFCVFYKYTHTCIRIHASIA